MARITVVGPVHMDLFIRGTAPSDMGALNSWVGPSLVETLVAGSIGYTIQDLARLGWQVRVVSQVGNDGFGHEIRSLLDQQGMDLEYLRRGDGHTTVAIYILLFGGSKRPMTYRLASFDPWPEPIPLEILDPTPDVLHCGGLLHFPDLGNRSMPDLFRAARERGIRTSLDPQFPLVDTDPPWLRFFEPVMRHVDVLMLDEQEGEAIFDVSGTEAIVTEAHRMGIEIVAVKRGEKGAVLSNGLAVVDQPAVEIDQDLVSDAVGAGDAFDAGLLTALERGEDLPQTARFATAAAASTLTGKGGADSFGSPEEIDEMLARVPEPRVSR